MKGTITNRQMFFLLFLTLTAYTVISIPKVIAQTAGTGGWFSLMITALFFATFVAVIVRLNSAFPGMMLYDYSQRIAGKLIGSALAVYYLLYFFMVSTYLTAELTQVLRAEFFPKTPQWAMLVASVIVFGIVAHRGVTSVARFFEVIGTVFLITAVIIVCMQHVLGECLRLQPMHSIGCMLNIDGKRFNNEIHQ